MLQKPTFLHSLHGRCVARERGRLETTHPCRLDEDREGRRLETHSDRMLSRDRLGLVPEAAAVEAGGMLVVDAVIVQVEDPASLGFVAVEFDTGSALREHIEDKHAQGDDRQSRSP